MISNLTIQNFKSARDVSLPCRRVNVLIGEPNTGKTNVLEAVGLFSEQTVRNMRQALRVTEYADDFRDQNAAEPVTIESQEGGIQITSDGNGLKATFWSSAERGRFQYFLMDMNWDIGSTFQGPPVPGVCYYLFANDVTPGNGETLTLAPPFGRNMAALLYAKREARQSSARFFENTGYELTVDATSRRLLLSKAVDGIRISFPYSTASETLRRMVFYHLAVETGGGQVLVFDEPEAHAFPPFTKNFAERIALDDRGTQYFLTTHSPYMLDSLLAKTPADDLNIVLCRMENFETKVYPLSEPQKAKLMEWSMDSFFNFDRLLEVA